MKLDAKKIHSQTIKYYALVKEYTFLNDPEFTYQELVLGYSAYYWHLGDGILDTDKFEVGEFADVWEKCIAHLTKPMIFDKEWDNVLVDRSHLSPANLTFTEKGEPIFWYQTPKYKKIYEKEVKLKEEQQKQEIEKWEKKKDQQNEYQRKRRALIKERKKHIMIKEANYKANNSFMQVAIDEARIGIFNGQGGPFGAVVVKDGKIIGKGHNMVLSSHDSTCHGEVSAIRDAEKFLGTHDLSGCELYTTGEPCTMCLCACKWANLDKVYYGASIADNSAIGFRDSAFENLFGGRINFKSYLVQTDRDACLKLFEEYNSIEHTNY